MDGNTSLSTRQGESQAPAGALPFVQPHKHEGKCPSPADELSSSCLPSIPLPSANRMPVTVEIFSSWARNCALVIRVGPFLLFKFSHAQMWLGISRKWRALSLLSFQTFHATSRYPEAQCLSGKAQWTHEVLPIGSDIFPPIVHEIPYGVQLKYWRHFI